MTVQSVSKMWSRDGGQVSSDGRRITVSLREGWQVITQASDTVEHVIFAAGLPQINDAYPTSNWLIVRLQNPQCVSPTFWIVEIEYQGEIGIGQSVDNSPEAEPPNIEWTDSETEEPVDEDDNGFPITNINGEPVDGVTATVADMVLNVERNYLAFNPYLTRLYRRSVNSDIFQDWPAGTAKLVRFNARKRFVGSFSYWRVSASIQFREPFQTIAARAWWKRYRNEGYYSRSGLLISITGGGGTGAKAYGVVREGRLEEAVVTDGGRGYTSTPTVSVFELPAGEGAGAVAVATVSNEAVASIAVSSPGANYRGYLIRATDDNKEPVTAPVLLAADGSRLKNTNQATWIERPVKVTPLPYNALGLI